MFDQQLQELRREKWRLNGEGIRTIEDARQFIDIKPDLAWSRAQGQHCWAALPGWRPSCHLRAAFSASSPRVRFG